MILSPGEFTLRYRVTELWYLSPEDETGEETAYAVNPREFRTMRGAEAHRDRLVTEGRKAVLQVGVLRWLSHEEARAEAQRLQVDGGHFG